MAAPRTVGGLRERPRESERSELPLGAGVSSESHKGQQRSDRPPSPYPRSRAGGPTRGLRPRAGVPTSRPLRADTTTAGSRMDLVGSHARRARASGDRAHPAHSLPIGTRIPLIHASPRGMRTRISLMRASPRGTGARIPLMRVSPRGMGSRIPLIHASHRGMGTRIPLIRARVNEMTARATANTPGRAHSSSCKALTRGLGRLLQLRSPGRLVAVPTLLPFAPNALDLQESLEEVGGLTGRRV